MTNGQNIGLRILTAKALGIKVMYENHANDLLNNKSIPPVLIGAIANHAHELVLQINRLSLVQKALEQSEIIIKNINQNISHD